MEYILTTDKLTKAYGDFKAADELSVHVRKGDVYGLIGRNGAGKTTLLKMICGLSRPTSGSFTFMGKTGAELKGYMNKIGSLIESPGLYPKMTAYQNIKLKCLSCGKGDKKYIEDMLELVGLTKAKNKLAGSFSLGMKQRLGIAIALVGDPEFLILDEPINGLDPQGIAEMRNIIYKLSKERGITIIVSSHILDELVKVADAFGIIHEGKLLDEFTTEELTARCATYSILRTSDNEKALEVLKNLGVNECEISGDEIKITSSVEDISVVVSTLVKENLGVYEVSSKQITLEEYYLQRTGRGV
jgi:ABC-2 type transport system ATP-binding protein